MVRKPKTLLQALYKVATLPPPILTIVEHEPYCCMHVHNSPRPITRTSSQAKYTLKEKQFTLLTEPSRTI